MASHWRVIDGCPAPRDVAPYIYLVLRRAGQTANSIYRGPGKTARAILHRHGKHTQAELYATDPTLANPPGFSQHELRSDGRANPRVPAGGKLEDWQVGVDSGSDSKHDQRKVEKAARHYGWHVHHPYTRGVEGHHWCFVTQPHPHSKWMRLKIIAVRAALPRR